MPAFWARFRAHARELAEDEPPAAPARALRRGARVAGLTAIARRRGAGLAGELRDSEFAAPGFAEVFAAPEPDEFAASEPDEFAAAGFAEVFAVPGLDEYAAPGFA